MNLLTVSPPDAGTQLFLDSVKPYQVAEVDSLQAIKIHGLEGAVKIRDYVLRQAVRHKEKEDGVRDIGAYMARCFREGYGKNNRGKKPANYTYSSADSDLQMQVKNIMASDSLVSHIEKEFREYQNGIVDEMLDQMSSE